MFQKNMFYIFIRAVTKISGFLVRNSRWVIEQLLHMQELLLVLFSFMLPMEVAGGGGGEGESLAPGPW